MALVDYASSDSESEEEKEEQEQEQEEAVATAAKKQKTSHGKTPSDELTSALPPLPAAFHDLYASTVRVSTADDPALHQGRKRVNPHKAGNWPSHLYIEWHPTSSQLRTLNTLLCALQAPLASLGVTLTSFLTSDLGAAQPLHVSLSRPIVLTTAQKDLFLEQLTSRIGSGSGSGGSNNSNNTPPPFDLSPRALEWHRTHESERSFLVLRVASAGGLPATFSSSSVAAASSNQQPQPQNPDLTSLLQRCNALVQEFNQPPLYTSRNTNPDSNSSNNSTSSSSREDTAFHISIAWTFSVPTPPVRQRTAAVFASVSASGKEKETEEEEGGTDTLRDAVLAMRVPVRGVKVKIGNVVTHVALPARGKRAAR
ncbi:poly(U)-specific 3'-to-5' RNA exonuclease [Parahypoxylon ruwenzoriense]